MVKKLPGDIFFKKKYLKTGPNGTGKWVVDVVSSQVVLSETV